MLVGPKTPFLELGPEAFIYPIPRAGPPPPCPPEKGAVCSANRQSPGQLPAQAGGPWEAHAPSPARVSALPLGKALHECRNEAVLCLPQAHPGLCPSSRELPVLGPPAVLWVKKGQGCDPRPGDVMGSWLLLVLERPWRLSSQASLLATSLVGPRAATNANRRTSDSFPSLKLVLTQEFHLSVIYRA